MKVGEGEEPVYIWAGGFGEVDSESTTPRALLLQSGSGDWAGSP